MTLSPMIKKKYLAEKVAEQQKTGAFTERRAYNKFWRVRIGSPAAWNSGGRAMFLCGRDVFPAVVRRITTEPTPHQVWCRVVRAYNTLEGDRIADRDNTMATGGHNGRMVRRGAIQSASMGRDAIPHYPA